MFKGQAILITGGTGSFGYEFVEEVLANHQPKRVVVYSRDELKQYEMESHFRDSRMRFFIGDVRDKDRLCVAMNGIDYVIHAAALKQVPAAEYNPMECIKTNILGGQNVIDAAILQDVKSVIALSTDKAANPINLYGATKLASDKLFIAANNLSGQGRTRFSVVRYGNVAGSRGSVVDLFRKIKAKGERVYPVTDTRMTRFWITKKQGVEFVVKCFQRMQGGELFVPKIPSMNIVDLVNAMDETAKIKTIGIRPGEKLHEIMCPEESSRQTIEYDDHYVIVPAIKFYDDNLDYKKNMLAERGKAVKDGFEYSSQTNEKFLTVEELRELHEVVKD